ncbi:MAG: NAD(P)H-dependent glycerol-3-phosphate dehydrogenase [Halanaerobiaceae bacterium]
MSERVSIIGGGSWGTAIGQTLASKGHEVLISVIEEGLKEDINKKHVNSIYFPDVELNSRVRATYDLEEVVGFSSYLVISVPTQVTRKVISRVAPRLDEEQIIISTAKGLEEDTFLRNSEIIAEKCDNRVVVLSGPTHAEEVIRGMPSAAVVAAGDEELGERIQELFMSRRFRLYTNPDMVGIELAAAVKNIMAVAAGIADGLGYGDNTQAALITRGLTEISRFGMQFGGQPLTFAGLAGLGDLVVTCTSKHSRNRSFGHYIGQGYSYSEALEKVKQVVEGVKTTRAVYTWYKEKENELDFDIPITTQVYKVLFEEKNPHTAVDDLMLRGPKYELEKINKD